MRCLLTVFIVLILLPAPLAISETISSLTITIYKDGSPLVDATVELWCNGTLAFRGTTDANGTVSFSNVTIGNYTIYVYYSGKVYTFIKTIDDTTTSITLNITSTSETVDTGLTSDSNTNTTLNTTNTGETNTMGNTTIWQLYGDNEVVIIGVGAGLAMLILIAYAMSGGRIPKRR